MGVPRKALIRRQKGIRESNNRASKTNDVPVEYMNIPVSECTCTQTMNSFYVSLEGGRTTRLIILLLDRSAVGPLYTPRASEGSD